MRTLVIPGEVVDGLLLTDVPVPTEGQPEWRRCGTVNRMMSHTDNCDACVPDGPFPFPVAVWQEVKRWVLVNPVMGEGNERWTHPPRGAEFAWEYSPVGAVVATVEVTGEGHHADECDAINDPDRWFDPTESRPLRLCNPYARLGCWHTPVRVVRDVTIPMERPTDRDISVYDVPITPALSWWAEVDA